MKCVRLLVLPFLLMMLSPAIAKPISIVAAENVYGDVAAQIGGDYVRTTSILSSPDQDPHLFEASPSTARALASADIVIMNGADYDPWMVKLLRASKAPSRKLVDVGKIVGAKDGTNPHLWYDVAAVKTFASRLTDTLAAIDPAHKTDYQQRLQTFDGSLKPLEARIEAMKANYAGTPVTATEPVFGYMAEALGLDMHNMAFQISVMNDTEPSISDVAAFDTDLTLKKVKALIYNAQVKDPAAERLIRLARQNGIPVVPVTETKPALLDYQQWMLGELDTLDKALAGAAK